MNWTHLSFYLKCVLLILAVMSWFYQWGITAECFILEAVIMVVEDLKNRQATSKNSPIRRAVRNQPSKKIRDIHYKVNNSSSKSPALKNSLIKRVMLNTASQKKSANLLYHSFYGLAGRLKKHHEYGLTKHMTASSGSPDLKKSAIASDKSDYPYSKKLQYYPT